MTELREWIEGTYEKGRDVLLEAGLELLMSADIIHTSSLDSGSAAGLVGAK